MKGKHMSESTLSNKVVKHCKDIEAELVDDDESGCTYRLDSEEAGNSLFIYIDYDLDRVSIEEYINGNEISRNDFEESDDFYKIRNIII